MASGVAGALGGDRRLLRAGSGCDSLEPGPCLEPFEDLAGLGEQRLGLAWPTLADEPLGVLEQRDREEGLSLEYAEQLLRVCELSFWVGVVLQGGQSGAEPCLLRFQ